MTEISSEDIIKMEESKIKDKELSWLEENFQKISLTETNEVGFCFDERMLLHKDYTNSHYERPERAMSIYMNLTEKGYDKRLKRVNVTEADEETILKVHTKEYFNKVKSLSLSNSSEKVNGYDLCHDTYNNKHTFSSAMLSVGGLLNCIQDVLDEKIKSAFAIIRPPGHHSSSDKCAGFCFFNNIAIAAKSSIGKTFKSGKTIRKVAIVDWDVHHGDGSQSLFYESDEVLFVSLHRFDKGRFYPCDKSADYKEVGKGKGEGFNINIPWNTYNRVIKSNKSSKVSDEEYISAFELIVIPILKEYQPDLILVSSGFDAAEKDQLGEMDVTPFGYYYLTRRLREVNEKVVVALEGGYNLDSLKRCGEAVINALLNDEHYCLSTIMLLENKKYSEMLMKYSNIHEIYKLSMYPKRYYLNDILVYRRFFSKYYKCLLENQEVERVCNRLYDFESGFESDFEFDRKQIKENQSKPCIFIRIGRKPCCLIEERVVRSSSSLKEFNFYLLHFENLNLTCFSGKDLFLLEKEEVSLVFSRFLIDAKVSKAEVRLAFDEFFSEERREILKENHYFEVELKVEDSEEGNNENIKSRLRNNQKLTKKIVVKETKIVKNKGISKVSKDFHIKNRTILDFIDEYLV